jgi:hypothetical protein
MQRRRLVSKRFLGSVYQLCYNYTLVKYKQGWKAQFRPNVNYRTNQKRRLLHVLARFLCMCGLTGSTCSIRVLGTSNPVTSAIQ